MLLDSSLISDLQSLNCEHHDQCVYHVLQQQGVLAAPDEANHSSHMPR